MFRTDRQTNNRLTHKIFSEKFLNQHFKSQYERGTFPSNILYTQARNASAINDPNKDQILIMCFIILHARQFTKMDCNQ